MHVVETIADRRIRQARKDGLFDDLAGAGKPIADLGRQRPPGWWALRQAEIERAKLAAESLHDEVRTGRAALWRLPTEAAIRARVRELNELMAEHNRRHPMAPVPPLDPEQTVSTWHRFRRNR